MPTCKNRDKGDRGCHIRGALLSRNEHQLARHHQRRLNENRCVEYRYVVPKVLTHEEQEEESERLLQAALM